MSVEGGELRCRKIEGGGAGVKISVESCCGLGSISGGQNNLQGVNCPSLLLAISVSSVWHLWMSKVKVTI